MFRNVLVPLDGSPLAEQALAAAVPICRRTSARLHLVHVRTYHPPGENGDVDPARMYLGEACERVCDDLGESVSFAVLPETQPRLLLPAPSPRTVAELIDGYARENGIDHIIMATHGRGGLSRLWFGSVADAILRTCEQPVLVIRPEEGQAANRWRAGQPFRHVLVPLDGSEEARGLEAAHEFGRTFGARYTLLRVLTLPYHVLDGLAPLTVVYTAEDVGLAQEKAESELERAAEVLRAGGAEVATVTITDPSAAKAILHVAREREADLIVLATHARSGFDRILVGSVADKVVRGAGCPVLVVRAGQSEAPPAAAETREVDTAGDGD